MDGTFHCCTEIALLKGGQNRHSEQWAAQNTVGPWIVRKNIQKYPKIVLCKYKINPHYPSKKFKIACIECIAKWIAQFGKLLHYA